MKKFILGTITFFVIFGLALFAAQAVTQPNNNAGHKIAVFQADLFNNDKTEFVQDEIVVKFKGDKEPRVLKVSKGKVKENVEEFKKRADVVYVEPNYIAYTQMVPNDPYYRYQWHLDNPVYGGIQAEKAWDVSVGAGVTVAVVDTGIRKGTDLSETCFVSGYDYVNNDSDPIDDNGHGTHVAGTIAQSTNNNEGVAGVAHKSCLMPVKVLDSRGAGSYANVALGIRYAADKGAKVINLSLGGSSPSQTLEEAVAYAYQEGATVIAACGNDNKANCLYPAAYDAHVLAVGATQYDETKAPYSNYGLSLDLVAPGGNNNLDQNNDGYADGVLQQTFQFKGRTISWGYYFFQGTSMAVPHVAGTAALIIANGNVAAPDEVRAALQETAKDLGVAGWDEIYGWGLVNAYAALEWTSVPDTTPPAISNISTANITSTSATVTWTTDEPSDSLINYGTTTADLGNTVSDAAMVTNHSLNLTGLAKNTTYYYEVYSTDASGNTSVDNNNGEYYTFTTLENQPPVANAGPDQIVSDIDGDEVETVTLDGSASYDPDGTIVSYEWTEGDVILGTAAVITYDFAVGIHTVTLVVTDDDGATGIDTMTVTVSEKPAQALCWAESNQYLYRNNGQAAKFCKCASGIYGYGSYTSKRLRSTVYKYTDTGNNEIWDATPVSSNLPISQVKCLDDVVYPTDKSYSYPK